MHRTICDFLMDMVQNSFEAGSSVVIVHISQNDSQFEITAADDGCGMDEQELAQAQDPFYSGKGKHDHRKVGLGIPFLAQTASMTGGSFEIKSVKGMGTSVTCTLMLEHVDTPPVGDLASTFRALLSYPGDCELVIHRSLDADGTQHGYQLVRSELRQVLGDLHSSDSLNLLKDYIVSQELSLQQQDRGA